MKRYSAIQVADYVLQKTQEKGNSLTPMQVLKLVYLCHGWMLGLYNRPLIEEPVEAWQYGPVIRKLYKVVKKFRSSPVEGPLGKQDVVFDAQEADLMNQVVEIYGGFSGPALSRLTHEPGTPWHITWNSGGHYETISNDLIEDHFKQLQAA